MPRCPYCNSELKPDERNPGKYLCYTCRKRFPASVVVPDDDQGVAASATQPAQQMPSQQATPQQAVATPQAAQPAQQQWATQPAVQQPAAPQMPQAQQFQQQAPQQGTQPQWDQPQQQVPQQGGYDQGFGQGQPQQFQQQVPQQGFNPQAQQWDQQPGFQPTGGPGDMMGAAQAAVQQNGGFGSLFSYLFVLPDKMKLQQIQMATGDSLIWYQLVTDVLIFLSCLSSAWSAIRTVSTIFTPYANVFLGILALIVTIVPIPLYLIVRKRMALFTKGSWAELILVYGIQAVLSVIYSLTLSAAFGYWSLSSLIGSLVIDLVFMAVNWIYFSKRDVYFDYENAAAGCKPTGIAQKMAGMISQASSSAQAAMGTQPGAYPYGQQPQQFQQGGYDQGFGQGQPQQFQQQQMPQQGGYEQAGNAPSYGQQQDGGFGQPQQW